jgi:hypothetical protein
MPPLNPISGGVEESFNGAETCPPSGGCPTRHANGSKHDASDSTRRVLALGELYVTPARALAGSSLQGTPALLSSRSKRQSPSAVAARSLRPAWNGLWSLARILACGADCPRTNGVL